MPPKPQALVLAGGSKPPLLPALFFLIASGSWFFLELRAQSMYDSGTFPYDWLIESLSDLGVDYRQVHPLKHHNVHSHFHVTQNLNFLQAGVCFGLGQLVLLLATRNRLTQQNAMIRTVRLLLSLLYTVGMVLVATIHAGPREKMWQIIGWHWLGLGMVAVAGNLNSILSAVVPATGDYEANPVYRLLSSVLGGFGLYSFYAFQTLGEWNFKTQLGLWQRAMVYPVLAWELLTAVSIVVANFSGGAKAKRA